MRTLVFLISLLLVAGCGSAPAVPATAADWTPRAWASEDTVQLRTQAPGETEHWFPVWLVVVDDQLYVRLGSRAAGRVEANVAKPSLGVRIAGKEFARLKGEPAPEMVARVAEAMAQKYWFDKIVHHVNHPLTLRLVPE
jgi:hypothetical protein